MYLIQNCRTGPYMLCGSADTRNLGVLQQPPSTSTFVPTCLRPCIRYMYVYLIQGLEVYGRVHFGACMAILAPSTHDVVTMTSHNRSFYFSASNIKKNCECPGDEVRPSSPWRSFWNCLQMKLSLYIVYDIAYQALLYFGV